MERVVSRCYAWQPPRAISSAGRAPPRQGGGHWFEPSIAHLRKPRRGGVSSFWLGRDRGVAVALPRRPQRRQRGSALAVERRRPLTRPVHQAQERRVVVR